MDDCEDPAIGRLDVEPEGIDNDDAEDCERADFGFPDDEEIAGEFTED